MLLFLILFINGNLQRRKKDRRKNKVEVKNDRRKEDRRKENINETKKK